MLSEHGDCLSLIDRLSLVAAFVMLNITFHMVKNSVTYAWLCDDRWYYSMYTDFHIQQLDIL